MGYRATASLFKQYPNRTINLEEQPYDVEEFRQAFLRIKDYNGYFCAMEMLTEVDMEGRWREWNRLFVKSPVLNKHLQEWQAELQNLLRAEATQIIAEGGSQTDITRARLILSGELFGKSAVGRPTKGKKRGARPDPGDIPIAENLDNVIELVKGKSVS